MAKIIVSFKRKENDIYEIVKQQGDQSNFIKDCIKFYLNNSDSKSQKKNLVKRNASKEINDVLNM